MKMFGKRLVAGCSALTLLATCIGTVSVTAAAEDAAPVPAVSGVWQQGTRAEEEAGTLTYPRKADISVSYENGSAYAGKKSITAVYDKDNRLIGSGNGVIGADGSSDYVLDVSADGAEKVKTYIWNEGSLKPEVAAYETAYNTLASSFSYKVADFPKDNGYRVRTSFESGTFSLFTKYSSNKASFEIVDDSSMANTGDKCAKLSGGVGQEDILLLPVKKAECGQTGKMKINATIRKANTSSTDEFMFIRVIAKKGGKNDIAQRKVLSVKDDKWHNLSLEFDLAITPTEDSSYFLKFGVITAKQAAVDCYIDDISVVCENAATNVFYDDMNSKGLKWNFEDDTTETAVTTNRKINSMSDTNKWTNVIGSHEITVKGTDEATFSNPDGKASGDNPAAEDADAVKTPAPGSTKMLAVKNSAGDWGGGSQLTIRTKVSSMDLVPGKEYEMSFWAFDNTLKRSLYVGLVKHDDNNDNSREISGSDAWNKKYGAGWTTAPGIIQYDNRPLVDGQDTDYMVNYVASMPKSWHKYTYRVTPKAENFNSNGYCDLCFVVTEDRANQIQNKWFYNNLRKNEMFYLDDIEIKAVDKSVKELDRSVWTKRASFEKDTLDMFTANANDCITLTKTVPSNTGEYSAKVDGRTQDWKTLRVSLAGVDKDSKLKISGYIRNIEKFYETNKTPSFSFQLYIPKGKTDGGNAWPELASTKPVGYNWTKMEAELDLSQYADTTDMSQAYVQIKTYPNTIGYYIDDFTIVSDKAGDGTFYDDNETVEPTKPAGVSDTASTVTYRDNDIQNDIAALYSKYADKFHVGTAVENGAQKRWPLFAKLLKKHFNAAVSDGYFKMPEIIKDPTNMDKYTFTGADELMKFCNDNGISDITGHALIYDTAAVSTKYFYDKDGNNLLNRETATEFINGYIQKVMNHFNGNGDPTEYTVEGYNGTQGHIAVWDVVNEAVGDTAENCKCKRNAIAKAFDPSGTDDSAAYDYVTVAFQAAQNCNSTKNPAELRYNDYCSYSPDKARAVASLVNSHIKDPLTGEYMLDKIGVQSHYAYNDNINILKESLGILSSVDDSIKIDITELDIKAYSYDEIGKMVPILEDGVTKEREYKQAKLLKDLFTEYEKLADNGRLGRVVFWTFADGFAYPNREGGFTHKDYAGLFDRRYQAKPQYYILTMTDAEFNAKYPDFKNYIAQ